MTGKIGDKARLSHMLDATRQVLKFVAGASYQDFLQHEMMFSACIYQISIVGETASRLTEELRSDHPEIDWSKMIGMRNLLIHKYFGLSEKVIWDTITQDLPLLEKQIETILQGLEQ